MKYSILINQLALYKTNLDLKDAAILDYLKDYCTATDTSIKETVFSEHGKNARYIMVNFRRLIEALPLLRIKNKTSISDRITKIAKAGFAKTFRAPNGELYIRLTPKINRLNFVEKKMVEALVKTDSIPYKGNPMYDPITNPNSNTLNLTKHNTNTSTINITAKDALESKGKADRQALHREVVKFFSFYKATFMDMISKTPPVFNWPQCERLAKPLLKSLGPETLRKLLVKYFRSDNRLYHNNAYSLSCFLSATTIHKLNHLS